jgi:hypothetical protein
MLVGISGRFSQRKKIKQLQKENRSLKDKIPEPEEEKTPAEAPADAAQDASMDKTRDVSLDETQAIQKSEEEVR